MIRFQILIRTHCSYRELVERNKIKMTLSGVWPAILYDESIADAEDELAGLFKSETLLRVCTSS